MYMQHDSFRFLYQESSSSTNYFFTFYLQHLQQNPETLYGKGLQVLQMVLQIKHLQHHLQPAKRHKITIYQQINTPIADVADVADKITCIVKLIKVSD